MILEKETEEKFGYNINSIKRFGQNKILVMCDYCGCVFEKTAFKVFMCRKNSGSTIDICDNITCINKKRENTVTKRYGVKNVGLSEEIRNKVISTCLTKYGYKEAQLCPKIQKKTKLTCLTKYGIDNVFKSEWCKDTIKKTNLRKYGSEYCINNDNIKRKIKDSFLKKYGVNCPSKNKEVANKISKSLLLNNYKLLETNDILPLFTVDEFVGFNKDKVYKFKCKQCGNIFESNYLGNTCYKCHPLPRSNIENELKDYISSIYNGNIKYNCRKEFNNEFEIDIFIPDKKLAIELDGNFYHSQLFPT